MLSLKLRIGDKTWPGEEAVAIIRRRDEGKFEQKDGKPEGC
jgi:hypothetical protein